MHHIFKPLTQHNLLAFQLLNPFFIGADDGGVFGFDEATVGMPAYLDQ